MTAISDNVKEQKEKKVLCDNIDNHKLLPLDLSSRLLEYYELSEGSISLIAASGTMLHSSAKSILMGSADISNATP